MTDNNKNKHSYSSLTGIHRAIPIILMAVAVFTGLCFITKDIGAMGNAISGIFLGLFSYGAYAIPFLIALHALFYPADLAQKKILSRAIFSVITVIAISSLIYTLSYWGDDLVFKGGEYYSDGKKLVGGGFIGSVVAYALIKIFGSVGLTVIAFAIFAIYLAYFFSGGKNTVGKLMLGIVKAFVTVCAFFERGIKKLVSSGKNRRKEKSLRISREKSKELYDDDFFSVDNGMQRLEISELGISQTREKRDIEENPVLHEKVYHSGTEDSNSTAESTEKYSEPSHYEDSGKKRVYSTEFESYDSSLRDEVEDKTDEPVVVIIEDTDKTSASNTVRDDSAEAVFGGNFDPYDMMMSEKLARKPSSKAEGMYSSASVTENLSEITPEDVERARRVANFERRKKMIIDSRTKATPVTNSGEYEGDRKHVEFTETVTKTAVEEPSETDNVTVTIEKSEQHDAPSTYSYTDMGFGDGYDFKPEDTIYSAHKDIGIGNAYTEDELDEQEPYTTNSFDSQYGELGKDASINQDYNESSYEHTEFKPYTPPSATDSPSSNEGLVFEFPDNDGGEAEKKRHTLTIERSAVRGEVSYEDRFEDGKDEARDEQYDAAHDTSSSPLTSVEEDNEEDTEDEDMAEVSFDVPGDEYEGEEEEIPPEEQNPHIQEYRDMFAVLRKEDEQRRAEEKASCNDCVSDGSCVDSEQMSVDTNNSDYDEYTEENELSKDSEYSEYDEDDTSPPFDIIESRHENSMAAKVQHENSDKPSERAKPDYSSYVKPPIELLGLDKQHNDEEIQAEINENTRILIETLESFNVTASIKGVDRGPRITRYEVVPARGVKVNQITHLFDDIALNLAAEGIRMEAPIPGKSAIGFEIPNKNPATVRLRELLECEEFINAKSNTFVCIGKDVAGSPVFGDIAKFPHALVAGATGMGKSVCINSIMISMLYKARPDEVKFIMIDPKKVEFKMYSGIPHLLIPVITEAKQAAGALMWAVEEMERRYEFIEKLNIRNIEAYNEKALQDRSIGEPMPKIIIVIDELNDLMMQVRDPVEDLIMRIAQKARAAGIHLIIGTQRPDVKVITGTIKANINTRISCKVTSVVDSRTILEMAGAEKLLNKGDMLFKPVDKTKPVRVQGAFVSDGEVEAIMNFLKEEAVGAQYDEDIYAEINKAAQKCGNKKSSQGGFDDMSDEDDQCGYYNDQQFLDAVELAIRSGKISTSLLQRKLSIGYGKAAKYIDAMQEIGIVSEPNGQKPRDTLLTLDEWYEKLSRVSLD